MRKLITTVTRVIIAGIIFLSLFAGFYFYNNNLFLWEAKILWNQQPFEEEKFKIGSTQERAGMVVDLIQSKHLIGLESDKIPQLLGEKTGDYYNSDTNSTYRLTNRGNADWILTFKSNENGKVERVFIRKSCCSISRTLVDFVILNIIGPLLTKSR